MRETIFTWKGTAKEWQERTGTPGRESGKKELEPLGGEEFTGQETVK